MTTLARDPGKPWGIAGGEVEQVRGVYLLRQGGRRYCLKPTSLSRREALFVAAALDHLNRAGFGGAPRLIPTLKGEPLARFGRRRFQLLTWQEGQEADYLEPRHVEQAAYALARLHAASSGFQPPFPKFRVLFGRWPSLFRRKQEEIAGFAAMAAGAPRPTAFDREYMRLAPLWLAAASEAQAELSASSYRKLSQTEARRGNICHHDLAHHNLLLTERGPVLVDFDYALADLGLHDLANLLRRVIRLTRWDPCPALAALHVYGETRGLSQNEVHVLLSLLRFPEDAWQIGRQYYVENLLWPAERFLEQLARKADTSPARRLCLAAIRAYGAAHRGGEAGA